MSDNVLTESRGSVALVTINRPDKLNALNIAIRRELAETLDKLRDDANTRVVVMTGAGEKAFVAGAPVGSKPSRGRCRVPALCRDSI